MQSVETLAAELGVQTACDALVLPRSSWYAARRPAPPAPPCPAGAPPNKVDPFVKTQTGSELRCIFLSESGCG
jgi:hypothetical protein